MYRVFGFVILSLITIQAQQELGPCDPIDPSRCYLPFPNDFWLRPDNVTGKLHLQFSNDTFPASIRGMIMDPQRGGYNDLDGWAPIMPISNYFGPVDLNNHVVHYWNISQYLDTNITSVLLDTSTGQIVSHFIELDESSAPQQTNHSKMFMMWPSSRLKDSTRYIVAYRFLTWENKSTIVPSQGFLALRDNITTTDYNIESRRAHFEDIFSQLGKIGWQRSTLQLAWDFTTASLSGTTGRMTYMRDDAFRRINTTQGGSIRYEIREVFDNISDYIIRRIEGRLFVPYYLDSQFPGALLVLDANGTPVYQGMGYAEFLVLVPYSLVNNGTIGSIAQFGHGLFETREEALKEYNQYEANQYGYVIVATDWIGMTLFDVPAILDMMETDITNFKMVPDRLHQAHINALYAMRLMKEGNFAKDSTMVFNGKPVISPDSASYYYGNSNGGIQGSVYMALTQDVKRGMLGVGGGPYALLLPRSSDFSQLYDLLKQEYHDTLDRIQLITVMELIWTRANPGGYMTHIVSDPLPNTQPHEVLLQHGLGDHQVTYVGVYVLGRSVGATMFNSNAREPNELLYGFPFINDTSSGKVSHVMTWVFPDVPPVPEINRPPTDGQDTHNWPRQQADAMLQMNIFFTTGQIINTCNGTCNGNFCNTPPC